MPSNQVPGLKAIGCEVLVYNVEPKKVSKGGKKKHQILSSKSFPLAWISLENILFKKTASCPGEFPLG